MPLLPDSLLTYLLRLAVEDWQGSEPKAPIKVSFSESQVPLEVSSKTFFILLDIEAMYRVLPELSGCYIKSSVSIEGIDGQPMQPIQKGPISYKFNCFLNLPIHPIILLFSWYSSLRGLTFYYKLLRYSVVLLLSLSPQWCQILIPCSLISLPPPLTSQF